MEADLKKSAVVNWQPHLLFMYFSEIYLKWHLSNLTYAQKKSKYIWACAPVIRVVIIIRYEALEHIFCTELTQKTQVKKKPKQQMLPRVI